jgi:molybdopterin converting factor small subunit
MKLNVLFFGATADLTRLREQSVDFTVSSTVAEVLEHLKQAHPRLSSHNLLIALNEEYVSPDSLVRDGDTLAVFTAVSGG